MAPLAPVIQALWLAADCELRRVDGPVRWPSPHRVRLSGGLGLGCIEADFREYILILQHFQ